MIIAFVLFVLVVGVSLVLAFLSMKDFEEIPKSKSYYGVFLIRNIKNLTTEVLEEIRLKSARASEIVSFERLFKGEKSALVIFAPKHLINYYPLLDTLELEDYTSAYKDSLTQAWEISISDADEIIGSNPPLLENEQFWWQISLKGEGEGFGSKFLSFVFGQKKKEVFKAQIRAVFLTSSGERMKILTDWMKNLSKGHVLKLPSIYASTQILEDVKLRNLRPYQGSLYLKPSEVLRLLFPLFGSRIV